MGDGLKRAAARRTRQRFYFFFRKGDANCPAGWTVCKSSKLPKGDFQITEYSWRGGGYGYVDLWFVDSDNCTADERQEAYRQFALAQPEPHP